MILGVDPGERRIGLALADAETGVAVPLEVIDARSPDPVESIAQVVAEHAVDTIVVGRPVGLSGLEGTAVDRARSLRDELRARLDVTVTEYDERLTSVVAERALRSGDLPARSRRRVVDAVAAQVMLQGYLDATRP